MLFYQYLKYGLNVVPERRERSQCSVWVQRLGTWVNGEDAGRREMQGFSLEPVTFVMTGLVFCDDLALHCGAALPTCCGDL